MDAFNFCYWLNGFAELSTDQPTAEQWKSIKEHLALVFNKVTPPAPGNVPPAPNLPSAPPARVPSIFDQIRHDNRQWPRDFEPFVTPKITC